jgi:hypothetical protein
VNWLVLGENVDVETQRLLRNHNYIHRHQNFVADSLVTPQRHHATLFSSLSALVAII